MSGFTSGPGDPRIPALLAAMQQQQQRGILSPPPQQPPPGLLAGPRLRTDANTLSTGAQRLAALYAAIAGGGEQRPNAAPIPAAMQGITDRLGQARQFVSNAIDASPFSGHLRLATLAANALNLGDATSAAPLHAAVPFVKPAIRVGSKIVEAEWGGIHADAVEKAVKSRIVSSSQADDYFAGRGRAPWEDGWLVNGDFKTRDEVRALTGMDEADAMNKYGEGVVDTRNPKLVEYLNSPEQIKKREAEALRLKEIEEYMKPFRGGR